jgi:diguanylate cyclase (GGDEF)-like protein/putative nucleotidyltransferase with HDIG domain
MRSLRSGGAETELTDARRRIGELQAQVAQASTRDPIAPALLSLKGFRAQLDVDVKRAQRYGHPLSLALIDIDGFRALNLRHGFAAGDEVLSAFGALIADETRAHDLGCRTGGDEFAVLLPETSGEEAVAAMGRMLQRLEDFSVGAIHGLSASIGIAALSREVHTAEMLAASARAALDDARSAGGGKAMLSVGERSDEELTGAHMDVIAALASALGERDRYTGDHSESVVEMAARVAESLGLATDEVVRIRTAALLHDIGKVGVPDEILHKPGALDDHEWEIMRQHPEIGERILRAIPGMGLIAKIVRHEHERWDGNGYPDGIEGREIPIGARIILACDAYHAMTSDRPYRKAMSHSEAFAELTANAGSQFDPDVVEALIGYLYGQRQSGAVIA